MEVVTAWLRRRLWWLPTRWIRWRLWWSTTTWWSRWQTLQPLLIHIQNLNNNFPYQPGIHRHFECISDNLKIGQ